MCNRITGPERVDVIATALSLPLTPAAQAWKPAGDLYPKKDVLVVAPWRGDHFVGVAYWGVRSPDPKEPPLHNARLESIGSRWWGDGFPCAVIATAWWHTEWLPSRNRYDTINALEDRAPFALLARGKLEEGRLHVALISRDSGGTSLYHPKRIPYPVALADAMKTPDQVPPLFLPFAPSPLLNSKGEVWDGEVEPDVHERHQALMEAMMKRGTRQHH